MVANMRLFPRMSPQVDRQRTALDEAFIAIFKGAMIGTLIGMNSIMSAEI